MSQPRTTRSSSRLTSAAPQSRQTRAKTPNAQPAPPKNTTAARKSPVEKAGTTSSKPPSSSRKAVDAALVDTEPIKAFLRIRPDLVQGESSRVPYLTQLTDTTVRMVDPNKEAPTGAARFRPSSIPPASMYTFSHIFPPTTTQSEFFTNTTLPLVQDILQGQNGLLFTYGVTNSGKTYTVQGGNTHGSAGIVPRTLDVIFNSIAGLEGDGKYRPVRLCGIERADSVDASFDLAPDPNITELLGAQIQEATTPDIDCDDTTLRVDRNYNYTVHISYAEVYNEKIYDLLGSISSKPAKSGLPRTTTGPTLLMRQALNLKSSPPSDGSNGKYIDGLKELRIHSAEQGKALIKLGQLHRTVFGTLANQESSRSHGIVTIKVVRCHRGERHDPSAFQVSRLTLVDLAGSERTKHTQTTGDRLKEAGNINKSLMILGRCMEVMRSNQRRLASTLGTTDGRVDTRQVKKNLEYVPFTNSKLTQILMDYFVDGREGGGKAVMIVNVNPYDTGYDENSHVMKFSALAREVHVTPASAPMQKAAPSQGNKLRQVGPMTLKGEDIAPIPPQSKRREVTLSLGGKGTRGQSERIIEVIEEEAQETESNETEDYGTDPLVEELFEYIEDLEMKLFESERRCALIEKETRLKVLQEAEERTRALEEIYQKRMKTEMELNERKNDAKFELLQRSMFRRGGLGSDESAMEELDVEMSLIEDEDSETENLAPGPKQGKKPRKISIAVPEGDPIENLPSDEGSDVELSEEEQTTESQEDDSEGEDIGDDSNDDDDGDNDDDDDDDYYDEDVREPSPTPAPKKKQAMRTKKEPKKLGIETQVADLSLDESEEDIILPSKKSKTAINNEEEDSLNISAPPTAVKKKKRIISKTAVIDEDDIARASLDHDDGKTIKRRIAKK